MLSYTVCAPAGVRSSIDRFAAFACAFLAALVLIAAGASADPVSMVRSTSGYLYFNKPGASLATHDAELSNCIEASSTPVLRAPETGGIGGIGGAIREGVQNQMLAGVSRARVNVNVELCMVVRGWRLIRVERSEGQRLARLDQAALAGSLEPWIGTLTPHGAIVREWDNDLVHPGTIVAGDPSNTSRVLLSLIAMSSEPAEPTQRARNRLDWTWASPVVEAVDYSTLSQVPEGRAVILIGLSGPLAFRNSPISLQHETPDDEPIEWLGVSLDEHSAVDGSTLQTVSAYVVPPGRWRFMRDPRSGIDLCLGAPSFVVNPGDVIFAGQFNFSVDPFTPDLSQDALSRLFPRWPSSLPMPQNASWENGSTAQCSSRVSQIYALEFSGFPYLPGYVWGGAAKMVQ